MIKHSLPKSALGVIDAYWELRAGENRYVRCPYFRNPRNGREKWGLIAYSGKGAPCEIEDELKIIEKLEGVDFSQMQESAIRAIMKKRKLGVECSGFITRVLDAGFHELCKKPIYSLIKLKTSGFSLLFGLLRPYAHIDIATLVHADNAREINDARDVMPGDILRFNSAIDHAALVTLTERDENSNIKKMYYAHAVLEGANGGLKKGAVDIINPNKGLLLQKWVEEPDTGNTIIQKGKPHIHRLHIIESLKS